MQNRYEDPAGHRQRLRERFLKSGRDALPDYELLELMLTYTIPRKNTKPMAKALLDQFGNFFNILQQPEKRLLDVQGVGQSTVTFFKVMQACLTRCLESALEEKPFVKGPEDIFAFIRMNIGGQSEECIYALYLDDARRVVHHAEISRGTVNRAPFYSREIFKPAMVHNATGLVLIHNHPEGQPVPSEEDMKITKDLENIAAPLGIQLIDHMIVNRTQAYSMKTAKLL